MIQYIGKLIARVKSGQAYKIVGTVCPKKGGINENWNYLSNKAGRKLVYLVDFQRGCTVTLYSLAIKFRSKTSLCFYCKKLKLIYLHYFSLYSNFSVNLKSWFFSQKIQCIVLQIKFAHVFSWYFLTGRRFLKNFQRF